MNNIHIKLLINHINKLLNNKICFTREELLQLYNDIIFYINNNSNNYSCIYTPPTIKITVYNATIKLCIYDKDDNKYYYIRLLFYNSNLNSKLEFVAFSCIWKQKSTTYSRTQYTENYYSS